MVISTEKMCDSRQRIGCVSLNRLISKIERDRQRERKGEIESIQRDRDQITSDAVVCLFIVDIPTQPAQYQLTAINIIEFIRFLH